MPLGLCLLVAVARACPPVALGLCPAGAVPLLQQVVCILRNREMHLAVGSPHRRPAYPHGSMIRRLLHNLKSQHNQSRTKRPCLRLSQGLPGKRREGREGDRACISSASRAASVRAKGPTSSVAGLWISGHVTLRGGTTTKMPERRANKPKKPDVVTMGTTACLLRANLHVRPTVHNTIPAAPFAGLVAMPLSMFPRHVPFRLRVGGAARTTVFVCSPRPLLPYHQH